MKAKSVHLNNGIWISGLFVTDDWGLSFIIPGIIIGAVGLIHWLFLVPKPKDVDLDYLVSEKSTENSIFS